MPVTVTMRGDVATAAPADAFVVDDSLGYAVNMLGRHFARILAERLGGVGIAMGYWPILLALWAEDGLTQKDIAARTPIDETTIARTLDRMERDGLVERRRNATDRRAINVHLTETGQGLREAGIAQAMAVNATAAQGLTADEVATFLALLRRMAANLTT
ncbi:MAG TPA: MarR family winged helix-turn-helix transcriptional regulator [Azospirillaceae bacterium]|nr:MarR family winged helix-turn-helix transcriptional regulator [Azospirillaceae bacterium]